MRINGNSYNYITKPSFRAQENHPEIFRKLLEGDDLSALNLIRQQPDWLSPVDINGDYLIHVVVKKDFYETTKQMLFNPSKAQDLLVLQGEGGKTPLAVAKSPRVARLLLQKGANPYSFDDELVPAGLNEYLPDQIRNKVKHDIETLSQTIEQPQSGINLNALQSTCTEAEGLIEEVKFKPKNVDTSTLRNNAAEAGYKKIEPAEEKNEKESKPKKSFFSMFVKSTKEKNDTQATKPQNPLKTADIEKSEQKAAKIEEKPVINEQKTEKIAPQKDIKAEKTIKIEGAGAFKRIDSSEIKDLDFIVGLENIKKSLRKSIVEPVKNEKLSERLNKNRTSIPNGILISGFSGSGKSTLVKALGAEAAMPVFEASNPTEISQLIDIVGKNYSKTKQRAIIYLRGLDNLYEENAHTGEITNELTRCLNDTAKKGALVIFSAECPETIPKSILTPGKIDRIFRIKSPNTNERLEYIKHYIKNKEILNTIDVNQIANKTQGFSIAQLKHVIDDSVLNCISESQDKVKTSDLLERIKIFSKEQNIPEINEHNKTSMYDTVLKRYQPSEFDAENFESVAGMPATKSNVEKLILKPWKNAEKLRAAKIQLPAGGVFVGDPGTSKSYIAKALARSLNMPLYVLKMSDSNVGTSFIHETSKNIGKIIDQLITKFDETGEASVLLMDEIDNFQKGQSQHGDEEINELLKEIERGRNKILFIGTTNELEKLPDSLIRDGRMEVIIHFEHCDSKAAVEIIKNMLESSKDNPETAKVLENPQLLEKMAKKCDGMVAASISAVVNDALKDNVIDGTKLEDALDNNIAIRKKKDIEKMLSKNSRAAGHRLNITENSTIMYDTKYPRLQINDYDPKNLNDLGGIKEIKDTLRSEIIEAYQPKMLELLNKNKIPVTKGFILHGPPGNGKTTIIKALANEMKLPIYQLNTGNIGGQHIHELAMNLECLRKQLSDKFKITRERSIVFVDEAQQLIPRTSGLMMTHSHNLEETSFIKDMLMSAQEDGIIYAMATNDLNQIEPAFYENADRLGICVYVDYPDYDSRVGIIKKLIEERPATKDISNPEDIKKLAEMCEGLSISKITQLIYNIAKESLKTNSPTTIESAKKSLKRMGVDA